jgi:hypothetical protein
MSMFHAGGASFCSGQKVAQNIRLANKTPAYLRQSRFLDLTRSPFKVPEGCCDWGRTKIAARLGITRSSREFYEQPYGKPCGLLVCHRRE